MSQIPRKPVVLVVEDDHYNMILTIDLLTCYGFDVVPIYNGDNLLNECIKYNPAVILMDISLKETDGLTLTRSLKEHEATKIIPVVALTAHANAQTEIDARQAGCAGVILKPIDIDTFPDLVKSYISLN